jgi:hypothetical protein
MDAQVWYRLAADTVLVVHLGIVLYVILGLGLTLLGGALGWGWVRNRWFRGLHLVLIGVIVGQAWGGLICPLTTWEMRLRVAGGQQAYDETFVAYWLGELLFFDAPAWVFAVCYSAFGGLVLLSLWWVPVRWRGVSVRRESAGGIGSDTPADAGR